MKINWCRVVRLLAAACLVRATITIGTATTIVAPQFAELAAKADQVLHGRVTEIRCERDGRKIVTHVTVQDLEAGGACTLDFLGGRIGDEEMHVSGMPQFAVGQEVILFVKDNQRVICPVMGWTYGAFEVRADASAAKRVFRLRGGDQVMSIRASDVGQVDGLTLAEFQRRVASEREVNREK